MTLAVRFSLFAGLLAGTGCCLAVVSGGSENDETSAGTQTSGGSSSGRGSSTGGASSTGGSNSGSSTGATDPCSGVYCSPSYVCDPADGICKCGGQVCPSGNCDASTGNCLGGCPPDAGSSDIAFLSGPPEASVMPPADLNKTYNFNIGVCAYGPVRFSALSEMPPGLDFYVTGEIEGVPTIATHGVPYEFEVKAESEGGGVAFQNFLLTVVGNP
jgi:hypothetical protein